MKDGTARQGRPDSNSITAPSVPPRLIIDLSLEASPKVYEEAMHEGDSRRLADWIGSRPELDRLVRDAIRLMAREAA